LPAGVVAGDGDRAGDGTGDGDSGDGDSPTTRDRGKGRRVDGKLGNGRRDMGRGHAQRKLDAMSEVDPKP